MKLIAGLFAGAVLAAPMAMLLAGSTYAQTAKSPGAARVAGRHFDARGRAVQQFCPSDGATDTTGAHRFRCFGYQIVDSMGMDAVVPEANGTCSASQGLFATALPHAMAPADIQNAYGLTGLPASGGAVVAVVDLYGYAKALTDLNAYRTHYGLAALPKCTGTVPTVGGPACFANIDQTGVTSHLADDPQGSNGWGGESALDLQMVSAACPDCSIVLVSVDPQSSDNDPFSTAVAKVASVVPGLAAISNSYGGPEQGGDDDSAYNQPGILVLAASGDQDYMDEGWTHSASPHAPNYPASSPHVLSVGGTTPSPDATSPSGFSEVVWDMGIDPQSGKAAGGGSGCSTLFAKPSWQSGIQDPTCTKRASVDLAAASDFDSKVKNDAGHDTGGISVYAGGCWTAVGGTSAATPLVAGIMARLKLATKVANDFSLLYNNPSAFNDITKGNNDPTNACHDINCTAGVGWDGPTGMGSPNGQGLCVLAGLCSGGADAGTDGGKSDGGAKDGGTHTDGGMTPPGMDGGGLPGDDDGGSGTLMDGGGAASDGGISGNGNNPGGDPSSGGCSATTAPSRTGFGAAGVIFGLAALRFARRRRR